MGEWVDAVESRARLIHEQMSIARGLAEKNGGDPNVIVKPYLELLRKLYEDEFAFAQLADSSDLIARFSGPAIAHHDPSVTIVAGVFTDIRNQIRGIAKSIVGLIDTQRLKWPAELDPHLAGLARGSLVVGVSVPRPEEEKAMDQATVPGSSDLIYESVRAAVRSLSSIARYIKDDKVSEEIIEEFSDPAVRDTVMVAASRLAPTGRRGIESVTLIGPERDGAEPVGLTPASRRALIQSLHKPIRISGSGVFEGIVREIDLDAHRFEIRGVREAGSIRCMYDPRHQELVRKMLDAQISVSGNYETQENQQPRLISVESIKIVRFPGEQSSLDPYAS